MSNILDFKIIKKIKKCDDYNFSLFSGLFDLISIKMAKEGKLYLKNGELLKEADKHKENFNLWNDVKNNLESHVYTNIIETEIRTKYLLLVNKDDSFEKLFSELKLKIRDKLSEKDSSIIEKVIKNAEKRIFKDEIICVNPPAGNELGVLEKMNKKDFEEKFGYELCDEFHELILDKRSDDHDIVAMKEFIRILSGEKIEELSIGFGYLGKYMKELLDEGISSISFEVSKNVLTKMHLSKREFSLDDLDKNYSPVMSSVELLKAFGTNVDKFYDSLLSSEFVEFSNPNSSFLTKGKRYYVLCPSTIVYDDERILRGCDCFMFSHEKEITQTRLYFIPEKQSETRIVHHMSSVIFGTSCFFGHPLVKYNENESSFYFERYKKYLIETKEYDAFPKELYSDAVYGFLYKNDKESFDKKYRLAVIEKNENKERITEIVSSRSGISGFTMANEIDSMNKYFPNLKEDDFILAKNVVSQLTKLYTVFPKRYDLIKYLSGEVGSRIISYYGADQDYEDSFKKIMLKQG